MWKKKKKKWEKKKKKEEEKNIVISKRKMSNSALIRARSLLRDKKRSCCLIFLRASISFGKRSGCSKASPTWEACPLWKSLTEAVHGMAAPSTSNLGDQVHCWRCTSTPLSSSLLSAEEALFSLGSLVVFYCLVPFWGGTSPSSSSCTGLFFFKFELACNSRSVGGRGRGGGKVGGSLDLGASLEVNPVFLTARNSFRPLPPPPPIQSHLVLLFKWSVWMGNH